MDKDRQSTEGEREEENEYYYLENGLIVFKATFLLKRGYCCKRGCRHCPYGFRKDSAKDEKSKDD
ncbi:DUF5522 domain-containing protein [Chryseolinea sp. T2]|uniref:DUF5522 domain-containing protein n=1 Tax=Chryseolinea sp. T2 TaxID=3129255 RepID=UPI0030771B29